MSVSDFAGPWPNGHGFGQPWRAKMLEFSGGAVMKKLFLGTATLVGGLPFIDGKFGAPPDSRR